jgi:hypothetical protein
MDFNNHLQVDDAIPERLPEAKLIRTGESYGLIENIKQ